MEKIKIAICDDIKYIGEYFVESLSEESDFEVIGTANDYIIKTQPIEAVKEAIRAAYNNRVMLHPNISKVVLRELQQIRSSQLSLLNAINMLSQLTSSEPGILHDLCSGYSYAQIAAKRFVEEGTIRVHIVRIKKKFGIKNTNHLIKELKNLNVFEAFDVLGGKKSE